MGRVTAPDQVQKILALALSSDLRTNELTTPAQSLLKEETNIEIVWKWIQQNYDALIPRLSPTDAGSLPVLTVNFCSPAHAAAVKNFFEPKVGALPGGSRNLQRAIDQINICAAKRNAHEADL